MIAIKLMFLTFAAVDSKISLLISSFPASSKVVDFLIIYSTYLRAFLNFEDLPALHLSFRFRFAMVLLSNVNFLTIPRLLTWGNELGLGRITVSCLFSSIKHVLGK